MTMLDEIVSNDVLPHRRRDGAFAREWAAYKHALAAVEALNGELPRRDARHPLALLDEAAVALVNAAWHAGADVGHAFALAEQSLDTPWRICPRCQGNGTRHHIFDAEKDEPCIVCRGNGYVPAEMD